MESEFQHVYALGQVAHSTLGPGGCLHLSRDKLSSASVVLFDVDSPVLKQFDNPTHPVSRLILRAILAQRHELGDGGWTMLWLVTQLLRSARARIPQIPRADILVGHMLALQIIDKFYQRNKRGLDEKTNKIETLLCLVRSTLRTRAATMAHIDNQGCEHLSILILRVFLNALDANVDTLQRVRLVQLPGTSLAESHIVRGLTLDIRIPPAYPREISNLTVIVYNVSITFNTSEVVDASLSVHDNADMDAMILSQLRELLAAWEQVGVSLVCCQKLVHPWLLHACATRGIVVFDKLSIVHIDAVRRVTNATIISSLSTSLMDFKNYIGHLDTIKETKLSSTQRGVTLVPRQSSSQSYSFETLVLGGVDASACAELEVTIRGLFTVLRYTLMHKPYVIQHMQPQQLYTELAGDLRKFRMTGQTTTNDVDGKTIQRIYLVLADIADLCDTFARILETSQTQLFFSSNKPRVVVTEALHVKMQSWRAAIEVAGVALRIHGIITDER